MKMVYPDYYEDFKCIADKCRHNCCIGWEIDIDKSSFEYYTSVKGDFGRKLKDNISLEGTAHFILKEGDRCPFLDNRNLCEIYKNLGEDKLCQICSDHPRFYNRTEHHTEAGLGLCCEKAAAIIITKESPVSLSAPTAHYGGIFALRDKCITTMQNRNLTIEERIKHMLLIFAIEPRPFDTEKVLNLFESLERLDESWSHLLSAVREGYKSADKKAFACHMQSRISEYEQIICYLIYRHMINSEFTEDAALYAVLCSLVYMLLHTMGEVMFTNSGDFSVDDQIELARLFSSEIEYSDENLDLILEFLQAEIFDT